MGEPRPGDESDKIPFSSEPLPPPTPRAALNFSRPRPIDVTSKEKLYHDSTGTAVRAINAFHEQPTSHLDNYNHNSSGNSNGLPHELRSSSDLIPRPGSAKSARTTATTSSSSASEQFTWDGQLGELRSRHRDEKYEAQQRYHPHRASTFNLITPTTTNGRKDNNLHPPGSDRPLLPAELPGSVPSRSASDNNSNSSNGSNGTRTDQQRQQPPLPKALEIVKRTSVSQRSEHFLPRPSTSTSLSTTTTTSTSSSLDSSDLASETETITSEPNGDWEDTRSHHTVSLADGESDSESGYVTEAQWKSSNFDVQKALKPAEIAKLRKKGIDPALYAEMKAARKGRVIGPLVANTFLG